MKLLILLVSVCLSATSFALSFDQDVPKELKAALLSDLSLAYSVQGQKQTPLHQEIFGPLSGNSYKKFFESRMTSVGMDSCGGGPTVAACVQPNLNPHKVWITANITKNVLPQIARVLMLFHEARHSEQQHGFWSHDICPTPFLDEDGHDILGIVSGEKMEGSDACDSTVYGSYGSSTIMIKNIAKYCTNCSDKVKMDAEIWADDQQKRIYEPSAKAALKADFAR